MTTHIYLAEDTLIKRALQTLMTSLGPIETARFLTLPRDRVSDYMTWRRQWQASLDPQQFFDEVFGAAKPVETDQVSGKANS
jgi:hypothetical protein